MQKVWPTLTEMQQQYIGGLAAGNQRIRVWNALMANQSDTVVALEAAYNSENSAMEENSRFMDSIQGRMNVLSSSWQQTANTLIDSDLIKGVVDFGTAISDFIGAIAGNPFGQLLVMATGITAIGSALKALNVGKALTQFGTVFSGIFGSVIGEKGVRSQGNIFTAVQEVMSSVPKGEQGAWFKALDLDPETASATGKLTGTQIGVGIVSGLTSILAGFNAGKAGADIGDALGGGVMSALSGALSGFTMSGGKWWGALAGGLVGALSTVVGYITGEADRLSNALSSSLTGYDDAESEVTTLNSELATTQARIDEINANPEIQLTSADELATLQAQNEALREQLSLAQGIQAIRAREAIDSAVASYEAKTYKSRDGTSTYHGNYETIEYRDVNIGERVGEEVRHLASLRQATKNLETEMANLDKTDANYAETLDKKNKELAKNNEEIKKSESALANFKEDIDKLDEGFALEEYLTPDDAKVKANLDKVKSLIAESIGGPEVNEMLEQAVPQQTLSAFETIQGGVTGLIEEISNLNSTFEEQGTFGAIPLETYKQLVESSSEYVSAIEFENGAIQLNREKVEELTKAKVDQEIAQIDMAKAEELVDWKKNAQEIKRLESQYKSLKNTETDFAQGLKAQIDMLRSQNLGIEDSINQFNILKSTLLDATGAYQQFLDALNSPNSGDAYKTLLMAVEEIQSGLDTGKIGTDEFEKAVALTIPEPNREDVQGYLSTLQRYITEDSSGVENAVADLVKSGLMLQDGFEYNLAEHATFEGIVEALKLSEDDVRGILGELEDYGFNFEWINEEYELDVNSEMVQEAEQKVIDLQTKLDELNGQEPTVEVQADIAEVEAQLTQAKEELDAIEGTHIVEVVPRGLDEINTEIAEVQTQLDNLKASPTANLSQVQALEIRLENLDTEKTIALETADAEANLQATQNQLDGISKTIDTIKGKRVGDAGFSSFLSTLQSVLSRLIAIDQLQIRPKTVTIYERTIEIGGAGAEGFKSAPGGRTLVGELGPELVVSDGKYYTVGALGAEFVNLKKGDIVFSADDTRKIMQGYEGVRGEAFANTGISGGGTLRPGGSYTSNSSSATGRTPTYTAVVEPVLDDRALEEQLKDTIDKMKNEFDDLIGDFEHRIFIGERNGMGYQEIISIYREMQKELEAEANRYRELGFSENYDGLQELQRQWHEYANNITETMEKAYDDIVEAATTANEKIEHEIFLSEQNNADPTQRLNYASASSRRIVLYKDMQDEIHKAANALRDLGIAEDDSRIIEMSQEWWDIQGRITDEIENTSEAFAELVEQSSEAVDNMQGLYDDLKAAAEEYAKSGHISVDQFQAIVEYGPQYLQYLVDENGLLKINEESIERLIKMRTRQMAIESAMNFITQLRLANEQGDQEALDKLLDTTSDIHDLEWSRVDAFLAMSGLTDQNIDAALVYINRLKDLENAVSLEGLSGDLEKERGEIERLIKYVIEMIKWETQERIDAINEQIDSFSELKIFRLINVNPEAQGCAA